MFGIEFHLSNYMLHVILWTNLVEVMDENVFLSERIRDGLKSCEQWSWNVIVLRSAEPGWWVNYSLPSRDKIKGLSNQQTSVLCTSEVMWTATYSLWYCPGKATNPSCIANYLGGLSSMIKHWQHIMTLLMVTWECAPGRLVLSVTILYLPHLCVSSCQTPSYLAFQHFTGVSYANM